MCLLITFRLIFRPVTMSIVSTCWPKKLHCFTFLSKRCWGRIIYVRNSHPIRKASRLSFEPGFIKWQAQNFATAMYCYPNIPMTDYQITTCQGVLCLLKCYFVPVDVVTRGHRDSEWFRVFFYNTLCISGYNRSYRNLLLENRQLRQGLLANKTWNTFTIFWGKFINSVNFVLFDSKCAIISHIDICTNSHNQLISFYLCRC